jgi:hypothetical protein
VAVAALIISLLALVVSLVGVVCLVLARRSTATAYGSQPYRELSDRLAQPAASARA